MPSTDKYAFLWIWILVIHCAPVISYTLSDRKESKAMNLRLWGLQLRQRLKARVVKVSQ